MQEQVDKHAATGRPQDKSGWIRTYMYNIVINAYGKAGQPHESARWFAGHVDNCAGNHHRHLDLCVSGARAGARVARRYSDRVGVGVENLGGWVSSSQAVGAQHHPASVSWCASCSG